MERHLTSSDLQNTARKTKVEPAFGRVKSFDIPRKFNPLRMVLNLVAEEFVTLDATVLLTAQQACPNAAVLCCGTRAQVPKQVY